MRQSNIPDHFEGVKEIHLYPDSAVAIRSFEFTVGDFGWLGTGDTISIATVTGYSWDEVADAALVADSSVSGNTVIVEFAWPTGGENNYYIKIVYTTVLGEIDVAYFTRIVAHDIT